jgi:hypothetical protein
MSRLQSLRLGQFWTYRITPLLDAHNTAESFRAAELFEAVGWLNEGVFCRYFDAVDADVVWIRIHDVVSRCEFPVATLTEDRIERVRTLVNARHPFRDVLQMTEGAQRRFELPLFSAALLIADRFASDQLAGSVTEWLWARDDRDAPSASALAEVRATDVAARLWDGSAAASDAVELVVGYLRFVEHMEASSEFFGYAASIARGSSVDFESYCERIGGLNAWRVPLFSSEGEAQFTALTNLVAGVLRQEVADEKDPERWSAFEELLSRHFTRIREAWETHHLLGFFARW